MHYESPERHLWQWGSALQFRRCWECIQTWPARQRSETACNIKAISAPLHYFSLFPLENLSSPALQNRHLMSLTQDQPRAPSASIDISVIVSHHHPPAIAKRLCIAETIWA